MCKIWNYISFAFLSLIYVNMQEKVLGKHPFAFFNVLVFLIPLLAIIWSGQIQKTLEQYHHQVNSWKYINQGIIKENTVKSTKVQLESSSNSSRPPNKTMHTGRGEKLQKIGINPVYTDCRLYSRVIARIPHFA